MAHTRLRPPTMADVARQAGVSHQTVSRVLGDHPNVREATRARVLRAIEEMGYRRNFSARALATRRTRTLGVVASDTTLYGPASTLFALEEAARAEGYLVSTVSLRKLTMESVSEALDHLSEGGVEGVVAIAPQRSAVDALAELRHPFPVVIVGGGPGVDIAGVSVDQHLGARLATGHLLAAGHRTVWHLAGPEEWQEAADRAAGWRDTLKTAGVEPPMLLRGDWSPLSGYRAGQELAGWVGRGLTAVFVANDQMALGVLRALREAGVRTPQDVAVVGFDDIPEAEFFAPPLTTVRQDFSAVGKQGIALLLDLIEGRPAATAPRVAIEPQLVVRASTFPYAAQPDGTPL
ncbi:LacI family DNA-binding transcriptional regulator [Streptomyces sp. IBSBF 2953]|uniref:LacI family DNA-binding transcriptional regulator n=1 Tax=Streptomyces TaxID=1883 RepID=UPI00211A43FF|nr:LacI family DNA-binding transcriptional regulator [Streptomyces scabiei]MCQ9184118.1 LacI family DNA-binding transcriptional regulator [Streptomyces hayashii]MDX3116535.1 LacI family DNA-binding transcriptional regulator [Streptomyces scabiei]